MVLDFLKKLFTPPPEGSAPAADPIDHEGFTIVANPQKVSGGWSTQGTISKVVDGEERTETFIRADVLGSREEAIGFSVTKARKIIDEQGERLFKSDT